MIGTQETASPIIIELSAHNLTSYFYSGWAYQILKQFDKEKMYEIFCSIFL